MIVLLHFGTLLAIIIYYGGDLWEAIFGGFRVIGRMLPARAPRPSFSEFLREDKGARIALLIPSGPYPPGS